jgi:hypothetical protein
VEHLGKTIYFAKITDKLNWIELKCFKSLKSNFFSFMVSDLVCKFQKIC